MPNKLRPFATTDVRITDPFWEPRLRTNRQVSLRHQYEMLEETGRFDNFRNAAKGEEEFQGRYYNDSDVYKWLEAACHVLATEADTELENQVDTVADLIEDAQEDNGYLNTFFSLAVAEEKRWTNSSLHELYCAGHFFEAAVAHYRATDDEKLLAVARRLADHIDDVFGEDNKIGIPGHEEIELALVDLYRETNEERYLELARFFIKQRGRADSPMKDELERLDTIAGALYNPDGIDTREIYRDHMLDESGEYSGTYAQDHCPIHDQDAVVGHAVRAMYFYSGVADVALETEDTELREAAERLWDNMATKRMYVTGGLGTTYENEGFTEDYDLPNETAYAETCAAIGNVFWNHRMLQLTGDGKYGDTMERALYNAVLSGISLDGTGFRYTNPLESNGKRHPLRDIDPTKYDQERFAHEHQGWFKTACCPPNAVRLLASLHRYIYLQNDDSIAINLYVGSTGTTAINGTEVRIQQQTEYPWSGSVEFEVEPDELVEFELAFRVPSWSEEMTVTLNGETIDPNIERGYAKFERVWSKGDTVGLNFGMSVQQIEPHPQVPQTAGKVAIQRGPLVYCLEEVDNSLGLHRFVLQTDANFDAEYEETLLGGVVTITGSALADDTSDWGETLYRKRSDGSQESAELMAIPYYAWGHRDVGEMRVWLRTT